MHGETLREVDKVRLNEEFGRGARGIIYHAQTPSEECLVKIFSEDRRSKMADKVTAMLFTQPEDPLSSKQGDWSFAWPQGLLEDPQTSEIRGYRMPYKDLDGTKMALEYAMTELGWEESEEVHRFNVAYNLAAMVAAIHDEGHAIGDFNHDNILIDEKDGFVTLTGCDAFHITDGEETYPANAYYPRYVPPEGPLGDTLDEVQEGDRFGLGVHIFQLLMEGCHPYQAQGPEAANGSFEDIIKSNRFPYVDNDYDSTEGAPDYETLPENIRELFERCFEAYSNTSKTSDRGPTNRPAAHEWSRILLSVLQSTSSSPAESKSVQNSLNQEESLDPVYPDDDGVHGSEPADAAGHSVDGNTIEPVIAEDDEDEDETDSIASLTGDEGSRQETPEGEAETSERRDRDAEQSTEDEM